MAFRARTMTPLVLVCSGLPGTGKSTIADTIAREIDAPVFAWDWLMAALTRFPTIQHTLASGNRETYQDVGYALMGQLMEKQLRSGQSAILDGVVRPRALQRWREIATAHDARLRVVECTCRHEAVHRSRVVGRDRAIPGWHELDWELVRASRAAYEPLPGDKLVVDACDDLRANLERVRSHLGIGKDGPHRPGRTE